MPAEARPTLVTAALPYANGPLHLGHVAGAYLPPDLYVRYQRLRGRDVLFVCGSDEHGVAILIRARQEGTSPQAIVDRYHAELEADFRRLGIAFDHYGRTSAPVHHATSQDFFRLLERDGAFVRKTEKQLFDPEAGLFLADRFVRGTCPVCGYEDAYGDQCERCGTSLSPRDLLNPTSTLSGAAPVERETTHWFLPLGVLQPRLETWLAGKTDWKPNVLGQVRSWLAGGLADRAMTRDLLWGVPVPPEIEGVTGLDAGPSDAGPSDAESSGKVLYVWFDAPIGYVSITKAWADAQHDPERWRRYWQVQEDGTVPRLLHFIGKDNIVFHTLVFPAILMRLNDALGGAEAFVLPENVPANEFLNLEGRKLSTSRGWAVWVHEALDAFPADVLRYALAATLPETKDTDFSWSDFQARVNNDLADVLGNFVHRTLTFAHRFFEGAVPPGSGDLARDIEAAVRDAGAAYDAFRFRDAVFATVELARAGNRFLNEAAPWHQVKTDPAAAARTIHTALQACASLSILLEPVVPEAAARLRAMLNLEGVRASTPAGRREGLGWEDAARPLLPAGHRLGAPEVLFRKIEDSEIEAQRALLERRAAEADGASAEGIADGEADTPAVPFAPLSARIAYDDFARLDLRAGRVVAAEPHPNADKLLRLEVDLGFETRQVLAGVRQHVAPEALVGRQVVVVANLAPRQIRGLESQGMLLFAEERGGRLVPVFTEAEPGAVVK